MLKTRSESCSLSGGLEVLQVSFRSTSSMDPQVDSPTIIPHQYQKPPTASNGVPLDCRRRHYLTTAKGRRSKKLEPKKSNARSLPFLSRKNKSKAKTIASSLSVPRPNFNQFHSDAAKRFMNDEQSEDYNPLEEESFYSVKRVVIPQSHFAATGKWVFPKHQTAESDLDSIADISTASTRGLESLNDEDRHDSGTQDYSLQSNTESRSSLLDLSFNSSKKETKRCILDKDYYQEIDDGEKEAEAYFEKLGCHSNLEKGGNGDLVCEYYQSLLSKLSADDCLETREQSCEENDGQIVSRCENDSFRNEIRNPNKEVSAVVPIIRGTRRDKDRATFPSWTPNNATDGHSAIETKLVGPFFDDENKAQNSFLGVCTPPRIPLIPEIGNRSLLRRLTEPATTIEIIEDQLQQELFDHNDNCQRWPQITPPESYLHTVTSHISMVYSEVEHDVTLTKQKKGCLDALLPNIFSKGQINTFYSLLQHRRLGYRSAISSGLDDNSMTKYLLARNNRNLKEQNENSWWIESSTSHSSTVSLSDDSVQFPDEMTSFMQQRTSSRSIAKHGRSIETAGGLSEHVAKIDDDRSEALSKSFLIRNLPTGVISKEARDLHTSSSLLGDICSCSISPSLPKVPFYRKNKIQQVIHQSNTNYQTGLRYMSEYNFPKAEEFLEKALRARVMIRGPHHFEVAIVHSALGDLGWLFHNDEGGGSSVAKDVKKVTFHYSAALSSLQKQANKEACTDTEYPFDEEGEESSRRIKLMQHVQAQLTFIGYHNENQE